MSILAEGFEFGAVETRNYAHEVAEVEVADVECYW